MKISSILLSVITLGCFVFLRILYIKISVDIFTKEIKRILRFCYIKIPVVLSS